MLALDIYHPLSWTEMVGDRADRDA